ncbi:CDP-diacylglycerol--glycerol-3-phosphate 3-phosphatidyltransferase [Rossellomorea sp. NPDC077527]|uniref:CDP-diacylglycerol--glycerol-3-phosphate 3-phosphatidyltransferase n=1 Tax=Rossellomorea sp. NPDC077527 TaxID=3364510 RepID=UPI0037C88252
MNLPNKITIIRILFIPVFLLFLLVPFPLGEFSVAGGKIAVSHFIAAMLFIIDARKYSLITDLGKFLDPLADKLLITAALVALVQMGIVPSWMAIIILCREFAVTALRLIAVKEGIVIAASNLAKWKTRVQVVSISALLLHNIPFTYFHLPFNMISLWAALIITVVSGWDYFVKNRHFFHSI